MPDNTISVTRLVEASPEVVWEAFTQPDQVAQWWGPNGFTSTISKMEVSPGGSWEFVLHGPDGTDYPNSLTYEEVVPNRKLSYMHHESTEFGLAAWHAEVTLEDLGGKTKVTLTNRFANEAEKAKHIEQMGAVKGAEQTLERLAAAVEA